MGEFKISKIQSRGITSIRDSNKGKYKNQRFKGGEIQVEGKALVSTIGPTTTRESSLRTMTLRQPPWYSDLLYDVRHIITCYDKASLTPTMASSLMMLVL